jgi:hypothetical protein
MTDKRKLYKEDGSPRYIRCYEKKRNPTIDRYTVVFSKASYFMGKDYIGRVYFVSMGANVYDPAYGFYQHGEAWSWEFCPCGSRIKFSDLPKECQDAVMSEYRDLWERK